MSNGIHTSRFTQVNVLVFLFLGGGGCTRFCVFQIDCNSFSLLF